MSFTSAKKLIGILMALAAGICIVGLVVFEQGSVQAAYAGLASIILLFLAVGVIFKWCRCPWCGTMLFRKMFSLKVCPACNRDLVTGKKKKGKGGKR